MRLLDFFRLSSPPKTDTSAKTAKERLQIALVHERMSRGGPDFLPDLQRELLAVIARYVDIDPNKVEVKLDRNSDCSTLEVNIELPSAKQEPARRPRTPTTQPAASTSR